MSTLPGAAPAAYARHIRRALAHIAAALLVLAAAGSAAGHVGHSSSAALRPVAGGTPVKLRDCFLTAVLVPRPASVLLPVFRQPLDLSRTFYGPDPLLGIWALGCERSRVDGERAGPLIASIAGVPVGLTGAGLLPLANNFDHALLRVDTDSPALLAALHRAGLPGRLAPKARYRHSRAAAVPFRGRLVMPGRYAMRVGATALDPTNPHDHANRFEHAGVDGRRSLLGLTIDDAVDRFCFLPSDTCSATVEAPRGSALARLLGGRSAPARAGFDHRRLRRVDLVLRRGR